MSSIPYPDSGSVISSAGIEAAYNMLQTKANFCRPVDFARKALGPQHFAKNAGGMIRVRDFLDITTFYDVTGTMTDRSLADIAANWTLLNDYTLNGSSGSGYAVSGPCHLVWFMNFRLKDWLTIPSREHMAFFAASYATDSGSQTLAPLMPVGLHPQAEPVERTPTTQEQSVSWWGHIDLTAKTGSWNLDYIKFYAARCQCGAGPLPASFSVPHGTVGFLLIKA